jgi:hypothetical protein
MQHNRLATVPRQSSHRLAALAAAASILLLTGCATGQPGQPGRQAEPAAARSASPPLWQSAACASPGAPAPRALAVAAAAADEHHAWGGPELDGENRLVASGPSEAEHSTGLAPWQRVLGYWRAVPPQDGQEPRAVRGTGGRADRQRIQQALQHASAARLQGLGAGPDEGLQPHELAVAQEAIDRVAVVDTPWSAAFVSWAARRAGLGPAEFAFSDAHADYAFASVAASAAEAVGRATEHAYRACNAATTAVRPGDMACQARAGAAGLQTFDALAEALLDRSRTATALPMHCDVVVAVDARGFDAVGGNVFNSVTRRRFEAGHTAPGRTPWVLVMQWRDGTP